MGCFKHQTSARHLNTKNVTSVVDGGLNQWGLFTHWPGTDLAESDSSWGQAESVSDREQHSFYFIFKQRRGGSNNLFWKWLAPTTGAMKKFIIILEIEKWLCIITLWVVIQYVLLKTHCGWHAREQTGIITEPFRFFFLYFIVYKALEYNFPNHSKSCEMPHISQYFTGLVCLYRFWQTRLREIKWKICSPEPELQKWLSPRHKTASFSPMAVSKQWDLQIKLQKDKQ